VAYVVAAVLVAVGAALILGRRWVTRDMAKSPWYSFRDWDLSDPRVQRVNSFGIALFGLIFVGVGLYIAALAARIAP